MGEAKQTSKTCMTNYMYMYSHRCHVDLSRCQSGYISGNQELCMNDEQSMSQTWFAAHTPSHSSWRGAWTRHKSVAEIKPTVVGLI